jgi:hypothetical protein
MDTYRGEQQKKRKEHKVKCSIGSEMMDKMMMDVFHNHYI